MPQDIINNDLHVAGALTCRSFKAPQGSIDDTAIQSGANIAAGKLEHQFDLSLSTDPDAEITAITRDLRIIHGASGSIVAVKASITGAAATGGDRTVSIDLQNGDASGPFVSVLSAPIQFTGADAVRTVKQGAVNTPALAAGDILRVVVSVAGTLGLQAKGLIVSVSIREAPQ